MGARPGDISRLCLAVRRGATSRHPPGRLVRSRLSDVSLLTRACAPSLSARAHTCSRPLAGTPATPPPPTHGRMCVMVAVSSVLWLARTPEAETQTGVRPLRHGESDFTLEVNFRLSERQMARWSMDAIGIMGELNKRRRGEGGGFLPFLYLTDREVAVFSVSVQGSARIAE
ncbi:hypothetical protein AAG570_008486 [Ranatra chinensis]|uniref:Uncharacterized protein n=1 Tax=Ranatra chinensis TaxID=642074 RepID=A0ABD0YR44_9HEMI